MAWNSAKINPVSSSPLRTNSVPILPTNNESSASKTDDDGGLHQSLAASNLERQEDELLLLQSVFMADFEDLRGTNVWKTQRPIDALLRLSPSGSERNIGGGVFAEIQMRIKCTVSYPADPPEITLQKEKGLSKDQVVDS